MDFLGGFFGQRGKSGDGRDSKNKDSKDRGGKDRKSDDTSKDLNSNVSPKMGPEDAKDFNLEYYLYHRDNKDAWKALIHFDEASITTSHFDPSKETKVLIPGVHSSFLSEFPQNAKNAYLENSYKTNYNVICVDWCHLAQATNLAFEEKLPHANRLGQRVGHFLLWLAEVTNLDLARNVHLVGFSVGAHMCGEAGNVVKAAGKQLKRITALDPSSTGYHKGRRLNRPLERGDAMFIDALHTDATGLGCDVQSGNVDYYVNGGTHQLYFTSEYWESHHACHKYFTQTIVRGPERTDVTSSAEVLPRHSNEGYTGRHILGEYCSPKTRGVYFVEHQFIEP